MSQPAAGAEAEPILRIAPSEVVADPFPHVLREPMIEPALYERLEREFPPSRLFDGRPRRIGARTGRDLFRGDRGFDAFLASSPAWRAFHDYVNSPAFLRLTLELFGPHLSRFGCAVDPERARLVDYTEGRLELWWNSAKARFLGTRRPSNPNDLYVRFDVEQSGEGYRKPVHCDLPNRLVSLIVYFCDAGEIGLEGGDLRIHEPLVRRPYSEYARYPREEETRVVATLRPRRNLGLFFLCANNSWHSVTGVRSSRDYRRFVYLNLSSRAEDVW